MTTQLNDKLIAVPVPMDAYDFSFRRNNQIIYLLKDVINPLTGSEKSEIVTIEGGKWGIQCKDYSILGLCSPTEIGFDCGSHVDSVNYDYNNDQTQQFLYLDYSTNKGFYFTRSTDSFRSLLQSKELDLYKCYLIIEKVKNEIN